MTGRLSPALALALLAPGTPALAQPETCFLFPRGAQQQVHTCTCPPGPHDLPIWGSGIYTGDSHICTAAVHAGVIGPEGGEVTVMEVPQPDEYPSTTANGVTSRSWDDPAFFAMAFQGAPEVAPLPVCGPLEDPAELVCHCPGNTPPGEVWGSDPYAAHSDVCAAARHAGVINHRGGQVTVQRVEGQQSYAGSRSFGVTTSDHGSADAGFTFVPADHGGVPVTSLR